jgi:hypothetical protein
MKRPLLIAAVLAFYALHQDLWLWGDARPLVLGFLPVGLFYHACYSVAASALLLLLVDRAWPAHLEREAERRDGDRRDGDRRA